MKKLLFLAIVCAMSFSTIQAQEKENRKFRIYTSVGGGPALFQGEAYYFGLSVADNNNWITTIGYLKGTRKASAPFDFEVNYHTDRYGNSYNTHPMTTTKFAYISFGRYYPNRQHRNSSFIIDAGIGIAKGQDFNYYDRPSKVKNTESVIPGASPNYIVAASSQTSLGAIARVGIDFAFLNMAGLGTDIYYNYCGGGISDNVGVNLRLMIGYMNRAPKTAIKQ